MSKKNGTDSNGRPMNKQPCMDLPMKEFWDNVPRDEMREALAESGEDKFVALAAYLLTPRHITMAKACRDCGVTLQQLADLWRKHNLALGIIKMAQRLPTIMDDTARDAEGKWSLCSSCEGSGEVEVKMRDGSAEVRVCPACQGAREVRTGGDPKARDQVFELTGLTGKQGPVVAIQQNFGSDFEDTMSMAQKIITRREE